MAVTDEITPEGEALGWFWVLLRALDMGDFVQAAEAQKELSELGWKVLPARRKATVYLAKVESENMGAPA
jgi:hypothetical protein